MNFRSIYFRLIAWYTLLMACICLGFGYYTYQGLKAGLIRQLEDGMERRVKQIGDGVLQFIPEKGLGFVGAQIETVFNPMANNRFIRITDQRGHVIYQTGKPKDKSFDPSLVPRLAKLVDSLIRYQHHFENGETLVIIAAPFTLKRGDTFIIEAGSHMRTIHSTLHKLLVKLSLGLPVMMLLTAVGGYLLVRSALNPVEQIRASAEEITFNNLSKRLPVVATGDSIEQLSHTLNRMIYRLEEAYQQASRFSADASHELRTPLTVIRGELEFIMREPGLTPDLRERLGSVLEEMERLSLITEGLFAISRLDAGEAKMQRQRFDLSGLATDTLEHMQLLADEKQLAVRSDTRLPIEVEGDAARLKQIVVNLLDNAIKYTPPYGMVTLRTFVHDNKAVLEISDTGIGISEQDLPHIFNRFYRADKVRSREVGNGAGLGLSIARSICLAHNATIRVESAEGIGSSFFVELPLAPMV